MEKVLEGGPVNSLTVSRSGLGRFGTDWVAGKLVCTSLPAPPGPPPPPGLAPPSSCAFRQLPPSLLYMWQISCQQVPMFNAEI